MSITTWLFLYLAGLVELTIRYRLSFSAGLSAFVVLIPLSLSPYRDRSGLGCTSLAPCLRCVAPFSLHAV